jgi:hypothetical protein
MLVDLVDRSDLMIPLQVAGLAAEEPLGLTMLAETAVTEAMRLPLAPETTETTDCKLAQIQVAVAVVEAAAAGLDLDRRSAESAETAEAANSVSCTGKRYRNGST